MNTFQNIEQALSQFLQSDNNSRKIAEEFLNNIPTKLSIDEGIDYFLQGLDLQKSELAELSAIYLKKHYIDNNTILIQISATKKQQIIEKVKLTVTEDKKLQYIQRACEILVKLYCELQQLDILMNLAYALGQSQSITIKKALMYLIEIICNYAFNDELLIKYADNLSQIFQQYLNDQNIEVQVCTFKSLTSFLSSISEEKFVNKFTGVFPTLLSKTIQLLQADQESGQMAIVSLNELMESHPKFIRPILNDLVSLLTEIISCTKFNNQIRISAMHGLVVLSATSQSLMRKSDVFKTKTVPTMIKLMTEVENLNIQDWNSELKDDQLSKNDPDSAIQETLGKIVLELGTKTLLPLFITYIQQSVKSQNWNEQHAGISALGILSEGCSDFFKGELSQILSLLEPLQSSTNPRIIYDLLTTYSFLCMEFAPDIQNDYGDKILPFIINSFNNQLLKVQYRAISSLINFSREIVNSDDEGEILTKFGDQILQPLAVLFQKGVQMNNLILIEEILTCVSSIAVVMENKFTQYYNVFTPSLITMLSQIPATNQDQINLRIAIIESIGYLLASIKDNIEQFTKDRTEIMQALITTQKGLDIDDPHHSAIFSVYNQVANCMKSDFAIYMPEIFNRIIQGATIQVDKKVSYGESNEVFDAKKYVQKQIDLGIFGGINNFALNTSSVEQKIESFKCIHNLSMYLGKAFCPYAEKTVQVCIQYFSFLNSKEIRQSAMKTIKNCISSCSNEQEMNALLQLAVPAFTAELKKVIPPGQDAESIIAPIRELTECIQLFKQPIPNAQFIPEIFDFCAQSLKVCDKLKKEVLKQYQDEEMDEDLQEEFDEDFQEAGEIMLVVLEFAEAIWKMFKQEYEMIIVNSILPYYFTTLQKKDAQEYEINQCLYIFDDAFEFSSDQIFQKAAQELIQIYINLTLKSESSRTKQNSVTGLGSIAKRLNPQLFKPYYNDILVSIQNILSNEEICKEDLNCKEAAIGALGRLVLYQSTENQEQRINTLIAFLQYLPISNDVNEAYPLHKMLLQETLAHNPILMNSGEAALNQLNKTLVDIKQKSQTSNNILDEEGKQLISKIIQ